MYIRTSYVVRRNNLLLFFVYLVRLDIYDHWRQHSGGISIFINFLFSKQISLKINTLWLIRVKPYNKLQMKKLSDNWRDRNLNTLIHLYLYSIPDTSFTVLAIILLLSIIHESMSPWAMRIETCINLISTDAILPTP